MNFWRNYDIYMSMGKEMGKMDEAHILFLHNMLEVLTSTFP